MITAAKLPTVNWTTEIPVEVSFSPIIIISISTLIPGASMLIWIHFGMHVIKIPIKMSSRALCAVSNGSALLREYVGDEEARFEEEEKRRTVAPATSMPNNALTTRRLSLSPLVSSAKATSPFSSISGESSPTVYRPNARSPLVPIMIPGATVASEHLVAR